MSAAAQRITNTPFIVFDVETTGVDPLQDRIVQFGAARFAPGKPVERRSSLVNPGIPIPAAATAVHRIDDGRVAKAEAFASLVPRLAPWFEGNLPVGYNALGYDVPLIAAELARAGITTWRIRPEAVLDPYVFVGWHLRHMRSRKLATVAGHFGIVAAGGEAHSAAVDCQLTGELLLHLAREEIVPDDIEDALREQPVHREILAAEFAMWGCWLYRDRDTRELRLGAGKECGRALVDVERRYLVWLLEQSDMGLTPAARAAMQAAAKGEPAEASP